MYIHTKCTNAFLISKYMERVLWNVELLSYLGKRGPYHVVNDTHKYPFVNYFK